MNKRQKAVWLVVILGLLFLAAISLPNLRRSHTESRIAAFANPPASSNANALMFTVAQESAGLAQPSPPADSASTVLERKLIRNAELGLTVTDVRAAAEQIRKITEAAGGDLDNLEITDSGGSLSATLVARVPASGLVTALTEYKKLAVRTDHEQISARDVTREFYDNQAHLRNLRAEEQQYLAIMKQAHTVSDILEVSQKLSDVRDRIERLQAQIQVMNHDIEMSAVQITLTQESDSRVLGIQWRPLYNAKTATHDLLAGLGRWMDWIVEVLITLPLILLWAVTIGAIVWIVWRLGRAVWRRVKPKNPAKVQPPCGGTVLSRSDVKPIP